MTQQKTMALFATAAFFLEGELVGEGEEFTVDAHLGRQLINANKASAERPEGKKKSKRGRKTGGGSEPEGGASDPDAGGADSENDDADPDGDAGQEPAA